MRQACRGEAAAAADAAGACLEHTFLTISVRQLVFPSRDEKDENPFLNSFIIISKKCSHNCDCVCFL